MKEIREIKLKVSELRCDFGNPKTISKKEMENLKSSILENGDFGIFVVNEQNQVLSGNQRVKAMLELKKGDELVSCKMLVGYSEEEQKRVLLEANAQRGKYVLKNLEDFLQGTSLNLQNFNISNAFATAEKSQQTYRAREIKIIPLVVASNEKEYDTFMELQNAMGLKSPAQVIKRILRERIEND